MAQKTHELKTGLRSVLLALLFLLCLAPLDVGAGEPSGPADGMAASAPAEQALPPVAETPSLGSRLLSIWKETGLSGFTATEPPRVPEMRLIDAASYAAELERSHQPGVIPYGMGQGVMILACLLLIYLAIVKQFEPLLLLPIGFGGLLANIPNAGITAAPIMRMVVDSVSGASYPVVAEPGGFLYYIFSMGVSTGVFPLLIFMGVGAMTDFGPLIANPKTALLGGAAQFGIFSSLLGALVLNDYIPGLSFSLRDAASIGIIGGADGPTAIWLTTKLSPDLLGAIAVAAYSYMALVPIIQPPIMRLLTTDKERRIVMEQLRPVKKIEKVLFPILVVLLCALLLPSASPLMGALMLGNLARECGVVERLSDTMANALINIVTILLGLSVGSKLAAEKFLNLETLGILGLGLAAFTIGTASGVLMAKAMNLLLKEKINPLIGSAGVSAVPMAARVSNRVGMEADPSNFLLMHAMGPNVAGVIGSAVAAGVLYRLCSGL
jgi:oxaloacetate decarboxylase beta subunit